MNTPEAYEDGGASHVTSGEIEMSTEEYKRQRGYVKASITRKTIRKLISETKNVDSVENKLLVFEDVIQDFESVHAICYERLIEVEDIQQISKLLLYCDA